jgi:eukaryotic-like serine/threonine-protein kinase
MKGDGAIALRRGLTAFGLRLWWSERTKKNPKAVRTPRTPKVSESSQPATILNVSGTKNDRTPTYSLGQFSSLGNRYRLLRPHAKGGLGEVYVATDEELSREVAIKQIQQNHADNPESRARFVLEAELTGGLEHPGIVPVYGLGQYDDGRPFYAMRFIRGDSLKEAISDFHDVAKSGMSDSERSVQFRKLLGRFIDVCDAVEYAHSRGVLHRDLKPGNVMLGKYGETLVVDWGLAKAVGRHDPMPGDEPTLRPSSSSGSAPTQMGRAIGTPAYMSPEQASGRLDLLGPASDVYSLGATLFSLLTGQAPLKDPDPTEIMRKVQRGDIPRPRDVNPHVPKALEAICRKAMSLEPAHRYSSPRALAEDIEHWLADEPVSAYRDAILARSARWARRHKVAVATISGLLVTAVVSLSIGAALLAGANRRTAAAQRKAEENALVAQENAKVARQAVRDYMTTVSQETLLEEPGMQPLRRKLLTTALTYYQGFVNEHANDPELQFELCEAHYRVGSIAVLIGKLDDALPAFRKALELSGQLMERQPNSSAVRLQRARCFDAIAAIDKDAGRLDNALAGFHEAAGLLQELARQRPDNLDVLNELINIQNTIALVKSDQGKSEEAKEIYLRALELAKPLVNAPDPDGDYRNLLGMLRHNLGTYYRKRGNHTSSIEHFESAIDYRNRLVEQFPNRQSFNHKLSLTYSNLGNAYSDLGQSRKAIDFYRKSTEIREKLVRENPAVTEYRDLLAASYSHLGSEYRRLGDTQASEDLAIKVVAYYEQLVKEHPDVVDYRKALGMSYYNLGNLYLGNPAADASIRDDESLRKKTSQAIDQYLKSIKVIESLAMEFSSIPEYQADLANAYNNCGSAYSLLKNDVKAREMNGKGLAVREKLVADQPRVPEYRNQLASSYSNAAGYETDRAKITEYMNKSVEIRQALADEFPKVPDYRYKLAFSLQGMALRQFTSGMQEETLPIFRRVISILDQLHNEFPDTPDYRNMLVQALSVYAAGQRLTDDWKGAAETEKKGVVLFERLLERHPMNTTFQVNKARFIHGVGKCYQKGNDYAEALKYYTQAIDLLGPLAKSKAPGAAASWLSALEYRVDVYERLKQYDTAIADLTPLAALSKKDATKWTLKRARLLVLTGKHSEATAEARQLVDGPAKLTKGELYDTACVFALAVAAVNMDKGLAEDRRKELIADHTRQAIATLQKAQASGYFATAREIDHLSKDKDFDAIRDDAAFVEFSGKLSVNGKKG